MQIKKAEYLISSPSLGQCPTADRPEFAFIGRSNVGKSSLINLLCNREKLAKTSATPGKTQLINHFEIVSASAGNAKEKKWYLVDLPGYGFAKVSQNQRKSWTKMIEEYLRKRENLVNVFVLIDSRLPPQKIDIQFINQLGEWEVPFSLVFTKSDKNTQKDTAKNIKYFMFELLKTWESAPPYFVTSTVKKTGRKEILAHIEELIETMGK